ncbi:MAG: carboxymethylenebutenolidase, partial [Parcubacteria group bacterium Gr01-1014_72]
MKNALILIVVIAAAAIGLWLTKSKDTGGGPASPVRAAKTNSDALSGGGLEVSVAEVEYLAGANGFYAEPIAAGAYAGVVMIHEWWGLTDNVKDMAKKLAGEGYRVLAVDLFGSVATTSEAALAQVKSLKQDEALQKLRGASA